MEAAGRSGAEPSLSSSPRRSRRERSFSWPSSGDQSRATGRGVRPPPGAAGLAGAAPRCGAGALVPSGRDGFPQLYGFQLCPRLFPSCGIFYFTHSLLGAQGSALLMVNLPPQGMPMHRLKKATGVQRPRRMLSLAFKAVGRHLLLLLLLFCMCSSA